MDRAAILACPIMVEGVVMYAAPPNQVSEETLLLGKVIVSVDVAVGSFAPFEFASVRPACPLLLR